jgi:hypothetical protein
MFKKPILVGGGGVLPLLAGKKTIDFSLVLFTPGRLGSGALRLLQQWGTQIGIFGLFWIRGRASGFCGKTPAFFVVQVTPGKDR